MCARPFSQSEKRLVTRVTKSAIKSKYCFGLNTPIPIAKTHGGTEIYEIRPFCDRISTPKICSVWLLHTQQERMHMPQKIYTIKAVDVVQHTKNYLDRWRERAFNNLTTDQKEVWDQAAAACAQFLELIKKPAIEPDA